MELTDTHCHLTFEQLIGDSEGVLSRSIAASVTRWITIGTDIQQSRMAVEMAGKYENVFASVGVHPHYAADVSDNDIAELGRLAGNEKVVAIGEAGLDLHYNFSKEDVQKTVFKKQLRLAAELDLPVIVHSREAFDETMEILEQFGQSLKRVVFHCFTGSAQQAKIVIDKGYSVSFTGVVTFKSAGSIREAAKIVPLERMMIETDCPYMSPEPMRKQKINEPALLIHTAEKLAELKGVSLTDFAEKIEDTTTLFFGLPNKRKE